MSISSKTIVFSRKPCQRSYLPFCFILRDLLKKLCRYLLTFEVDRIQGLATLTANTSELPQRWCACKLGFSSNWIPTLLVCGKTLYRSNRESTKGRCPAHSSSGVGDVGIWDFNAKEPDQTAVLRLNRHLSRHPTPYCLIIFASWDGYWTHDTRTWHASSGL